MESNRFFASGKPLRVLEVGAGNGIVAAELKAQLDGRIESLIGTDIQPEAHEAAMRDRPGVYDQYFVADLLDKAQLVRLGEKNFDVVVTCAALGPEWGDMPVQVLRGALTVVQDGGLVAITVNEYWLGKSDETPWGHFIAKLGGKNMEGWSDLRELERKRYKHRLDVRGKWIWYVAVIFEKTGPCNGA